MKTVELHPERFLEAGGRISLAEWAELSDAERDALADAGAALRVAEAELIVQVLTEAVAVALEGKKLESMVKKAMQGVKV